MYMLSGCVLIDIETISLLSQNMNFGGEWANKGNNKITELRTILQRESQNS
jgi:hypothetical protein